MVPVFPTYLQVELILWPVEGQMLKSLCHHLPAHRSKGRMMAHPEADAEPISLKTAIGQASLDDRGLLKLG